MDGIKTFFDRCASFFFPKKCAFCGAVIPRGEMLCAACAASAPFIRGAVCGRCGRGTGSCRCGKSRMEYERLAAPFYYEGAARRGIHRIKFQKKPAGTDAFAYYMEKAVAKAYEGCRFDYITAVPMTKKETADRGFNQSALLARALSVRLNLPYRELLRKPRDIRPQRSCGGAERWGNVFGAFEVPADADLKNKTILLADDVSTTGATLNECAKVLKLAGATSVYCIAAACVKSRD